jgi:hypothetical protein
VAEKLLALFQGTTNPKIRLKLLEIAGQTEAGKKAVLANLPKLLKCVDSSPDMRLRQNLTRYRTEKTM